MFRCRSKQLSFDFVLDNNISINIEYIVHGSKNGLLYGLTYFGAYIFVDEYDKYRFSWLHYALSSAWRYQVSDEDT